ncbi:hypothetical protein OHD62_23670 [Mesorhizobium sp. YC-39]|nr:hypothetical protein [Mesorhizobium sp. YC-2]MCV3231383.1 hypothetical protein [Mesorhizobium sp. YC-39]
MVADNDEDPADSFNYVRNQLAAVLGVANVPKGPLVRQAVTNSLSLQIVMVPWTDEQGNLETMCITPARNAQKAVGTHVDNFAAVTKADSWQSLSRRNEMWLRSNLAARCKTDPFVPLGIVFQDHKDLIPLKDKSFDRLANVLESYR